MVPLLYLLQSILNLNNDLPMQNDYHNLIVDSISTFDKAKIKNIIFNLLRNCKEKNLNHSQKFIFNPDNSKIYNEINKLDAFNIITSDDTQTYEEIDLIKPSLSVFGMNNIDKISFTNLNTENKDVICNNIFLYHLNDNNVMRVMNVLKEGVIKINRNGEDVQLFNSNKLIMKFGDNYSIDNSTFNDNILYYIMFDFNVETVNTPIMINIHTKNDIIYSMLTCIMDVKLIIYFNDNKTIVKTCALYTGNVSSIINADTDDLSNNKLIDVNNDKHSYIENLYPKWYGLVNADGTTINVQLSITNNYQTLVISNIMAYIGHSLSDVIKANTYYVQPTVLNKDETTLSLTIDAMVLYAIKFTVVSSARIHSIMKVSVNNVDIPNNSLSFNICVQDNTVFLLFKTNERSYYPSLQLDVIPTDVDLFGIGYVYQYADEHLILSSPLIKYTQLDIPTDEENNIPTWHGISSLKYINIINNSEINDIDIIHVHYLYSTENINILKSSKNIIVPDQPENTIPSGKKMSIDLTTVHDLINVSFQIHMLYIHVTSFDDVLVSDLIFQLEFVFTDDVSVIVDTFTLHNTNNIYFIKLISEYSIIPTVEKSLFDHTLYYTNLNLLGKYNKFDIATVNKLVPIDYTDRYVLEKYTDLENSIGTNLYNLLLPIDIKSISIYNVDSNVINKNINVYYRDDNNVITFSILNRKKQTFTKKYIDLEHNEENRILNNEFVFSDQELFNVLCVEIENSNTEAVLFTIELEMMDNKTYSFMLNATNVIKIIINNTEQLFNVIKTLLIPPTITSRYGYQVLTKNDIKWDMLHFTPISFVYDNPDFEIDINRRGLTNVHSFVIYNIDEQNMLSIRSFKIIYTKPGTEGLLYYKLTPFSVINDKLISLYYITNISKTEGVYFLLNSDMPMDSFVIYAIEIDIDIDSENDINIPTILFINLDIENVINNNIHTSQSVGKIGFYSNKNIFTIYFDDIN